MNGRSMAESIIAIFDFDGTITRRDSLADFIRFSRGWFRMAAGAVVLGPVLIRYALGILGNKEAKERVLKYFFAGMPAGHLKELGTRYALMRIPRIVRASAMDRIRWHQEQGHRVLIVTASPALWLKPWCDREEIELIATQLEEADGTITGNLAGANCYGAEKAARLKQEIDFSAVEYVYAYGDSHGDDEMLALADEPHYSPFSN